MRIEVTPIGDPVEIMRANILAAENAVSRGTKAAGNGLKLAWRAQVRAALGRRMGGTVRSKNYPGKTASINAASLVYVRPNRQKSASAAEIVGAHDLGATIRAVNGVFLAIPIGPAARMSGEGKDRITPQRFTARTGLELQPFRKKDGTIILFTSGARFTPRGKIAKKGGRRRKKDNILTGEQSVAAFILIRQVRLKKKMDLQRDVDDWGNRLPGLILSNWKDV